MKLPGSQLARLTINTETRKIEHFMDFALGSRAPELYIWNDTENRKFGKRELVNICKMMGSCFDWITIGNYYFNIKSFQRILAAGCHLRRIELG